MANNLQFVLEKGGWDSTVDVEVNYQKRLNYFTTPPHRSGGCCSAAVSNLIMASYSSYFSDLEFSWSFGTPEDQDLTDIYSAPEVPSLRISLSGSQSTDCSSESDSELVDEYLVDVKGNAFIVVKPQRSIIHDTSSISSNCRNDCEQLTKIQFFNPYKCLKPSLFNPIRRAAASQQLLPGGADLSSHSKGEQPQQHSLIDPLWRILMVVEAKENYYKIALMNSAFKYPIPTELLSSFASKVDWEESHVTSDEALLLEYLYSAPETR